MTSQFWLHSFHIMFLNLKNQPIHKWFCARFYFGYDVEIMISLPQAVKNFYLVICFCS